MAETVRSRFAKTIRGETPEDRYPLIEWATWWNLTIDRWRSEGLPSDLDGAGIKRYFGLDVDYQHWFGVFKPSVPSPKEHEPWVTDDASYYALRPHLYPDPPRFDDPVWSERIKEHERGESLIWFSLSGFFWQPRVFFGIEPHLYAFYDHPSLMKRMNDDILEHSLKCIEAICSRCQPDFMTVAEDMSYNHGPMISKDLFDEFMAPYYRELTTVLKKKDVPVIVDSDGMVEDLIPWFEEVGVEGILPLERMAGVDVARIRENHPKWMMIGGYDKTVMHKGEAAMRSEFERLMPTVRNGRYLISVDHQTPPGVSLEDYMLYLTILKEAMAV